MIATMLFASDTYFNSRPSARGDRRHASRQPRDVDISIHAPPRGATLYNFAIFSSIYFNSRPSARGDTGL